MTPSCATAAVFVEKGIPHRGYEPPIRLLLAGGSAVPSHRWRLSSPEQGFAVLTVNGDGSAAERPLTDLAPPKSNIIKN